MSMFILKKYASRLSFSIDDYMELRPSIRINNYTSLRSITFIASFLFAILSALSVFKFGSIDNYRTKAYFAYFISTLLIFLLSNPVVKKFPSAVAVFVYLFMIEVHFFGIAIGTVHATIHPATTYIVLLFVIPIIFIDRPWRIALFNLISGTAFLCHSYHFKAFDIFFLDFTNFVSFYVLGIVCGRYFNSTKMAALKLLRVVETERDTDNLTGVFTKAAFLREMERLLSIDNSRGLFLMIDVDNFKNFNDSFGHDYGDVVLSKIGECMRNSFRQSDLLGRFGGDEFFVFIPSTNDTDIALYRAKTLQLHLKEELKLPDNSGNSVTLSIGIAHCSGFETYQSLFKKADQAIYEAKANGKDTIAVK